MHTFKLAEFVCSSTVNGIRAAIIAFLIGFDQRDQNMLTGFKKVSRLIRVKGSPCADQLFPHPWF